MKDHNMKLAILTLLVLIFNIPFGFWRAQVKKFSVQWFLAIHIPVPFIIFLRYYFDIGFAFYTYLLFVGAFFIGQRIGVFMFKKNLLNLNIVREN